MNLCQKKSNKCFHNINHGSLGFLTPVSNSSRMDEDEMIVYWLLDIYIGYYDTMLVVGYFGVHIKENNCLFCLVVK